MLKLFIINKLLLWNKIKYIRLDGVVTISEIQSEEYLSHACSMT